MTPARYQPQAAFSTESGFTLLETLIALAIFAMVSALMAPVFVAHMKQNIATERKSGAIEAAQQVLDELREIDPATLPTTGSSAPQNIIGGERTYSVTTHYCLAASLCTANSRHLRLVVSFKDEVLYHVETVFTRLQ